MKATRATTHLAMALVVGTVVINCVAAEPAAELIRPVLREVTGASGIATTSTMTFGATWSDFDLDGDPDLLVNRHWELPWFYENRGRSFEKLPFTLFTHDPKDPEDPTVDRHGCAWGEATGEGGPELVCTRGADKGMGTGPNQLFVFDGEDIDERATSLGVDDPFGRGRTVNWIDYDTDGDLDLFITNAVSKERGNAMFRNDRGLFIRVEVGIEPSHSEWPGSTVADWDNDGDTDILLLDGSGGPTPYRNEDGRFQVAPELDLPDREWTSAAWGDFDGDGLTDLHLVAKKHSLVLKNQGGSFVATHRMSLEFGRTSAWFDVENDGDLDLFLVQGTRPPARDDNPNTSDLMLLQDDGKFTRLNSGSWRGARIGNGDGVVVADYDRDGRSDLFVTNGHNPSEFEGPSTMYRNGTGGGNSISVTLRGSRWNPWAMGARVLVESGDYERWYHVTDGVTARSQSEVGHLVIGLGDRTEAVVTVLWPRGSRDCFTARAGHNLVVVRGAGLC